MGETREATTKQNVAEIRDRAIQMGHDALRREHVATVEHRQVAAGVDAALLCFAAFIQGASDTLLAERDSLRAEVERLREALTAIAESEGAMPTGLMARDALRSGYAHDSTPGLRDNPLNEGKGNE